MDGNLKNIENLTDDINGNWLFQLLFSNKLDACGLGVLSQVISRAICTPNTFHPTLRRN
jgi:hypothetical protein